MKKTIWRFTLRSQQNKWFNNFENDIQKAVNELIVKQKLTNSFEQSVVYIYYIKLNYKENQVCIKFKDLNPNTTQMRLDVVVCACDETLLSYDGYWHLASVTLILFREYLIANHWNEINKLINIQIHIRIFNTNQEINDQLSIEDDFNENIDDILVDDHEIGNRAFRSLLILLKKLIPIWKIGENPIITLRDTLYIKLSEDDWNISRKQNHIMMTYYLLNKGNEMLKPDH